MLFILIETQAFIFRLEKENTTQVCFKIGRGEDYNKSKIRSLNTMFCSLFLTLLDLTDVCPLLTKQYIQVGLQMQYMLSNL
jgi:hypothetical protein